MRKITAVTAALVALALAGCASDETATTTTAAPEAPATDVTLDTSAFETTTTVPGETTVAPETTTTTAKPKPAFTATVDTYRPLNPATLVLTVTVTNTGTGPGRPECFVQADDRSGTYEGYDTFTLRDPVEAGATTMFRPELIITNEGAAWVTETSVECEPA